MHGSAGVGREGVPARRRGLDGWGLYLVLAVALAPVVVPTGPAQLAFLDVFNLLAILAFAAAVLTRRIQLRAPFAVGVLLIAIGSLIATVSAESPASSALALAQDAYLYVWFIVLVSVLRSRGDLVGLRIAWVAAACVIAIHGIVVILGQASLARILSPRGIRAVGTFYDPNMFADYLVMSVFIVLSLGHHMGRVLRFGAIALLLAALVTTKSNGGALSLLVGLAVWGVVRARTLRVSAPALAGAALVLVSTGLLGWWLSSSVGAGASLEQITAKSFLARAGRSSEGRLKIWRQLEQNWRTSPLGIGPGNSRWISLSVEDRERRNSMYAKEAHSDYLAYAIERGPLAALALLLLAAQAFRKLAQAWRQRARGGAADRASGALVAGLAGALACSAVHSLTIERLHFRHFWLLLAIVCALAETARARGAAHPARAAAEREEPARSLVAAGA